MLDGTILCDGNSIERQLAARWLYTYEGNRGTIYTGQRSCGYWPMNRTVSSHVLSHVLYDLFRICDSGEKVARPPWYNRLSTEWKGHRLRLWTSADPNFLEDSRNLAGTVSRHQRGAVLLVCSCVVLRAADKTDCGWCYIYL